jgi:SAM-dependent methyltransferase
MPAMQPEDQVVEPGGPSSVPFPPPDLLSRIGPTPDPNSEEGREFFEATGRDRRRAILGLLPEGYSFEGRRVLDFGCGAGRVLRQFAPEAAGAEFWGCDLHQPTIEWLSEHLSPPMQFFVNDRRPMPQPDGYFDLVYALSVFTHITYEWSDWLLELHRVLKPDGLLLATFMGPATWERAVQHPVEEEQLGMAVLGLHRGLDNTSGPIVLHSPWWLRTHWGRAFEILALEPAGFVMPDAAHGVVLASKRDVSLSTEDLERPDADDPREVRAQRLQMQLLEENAARVNTKLSRQRDRIAKLAITVRALKGDGVKGTGP